MNKDSKKKNHDDDNIILASVDIIEPLGKEILITVIIIDSEFSLNLLIPSQWQGKRKDIIKLQLDLKQLCLFEPMTGERII